MYYQITKRLLIVFCGLLLFTACQNDPAEEARSYNNQIVTIQNELTTEVDTFLQSINYAEANTAILYQSAQKSVPSVMEKLKSMKQFEGGTALFIETQNYIKICQNALMDEGAKLVELKAKLSVNYNQKDLSLMNQISSGFYAKIKTAAQKFDKAQLDFAKKYQFEITANMPK